MSWLIWIVFFVVALLTGTNLSDLLLTIARQ
jgi:hypothetical protein